MKNITRRTVLAALTGVALVTGSGAAWAQVSQPINDPGNYGYKYRADMACGQSWIKVCEL